MGFLARQEASHTYRKAQVRISKINHTVNGRVLNDQRRGGIHNSRYLLTHFKTMVLTGFWIYGST
jgi:hypothetical protein